MRAEKGIGRIKNERHRIVWDNIPVWHKMRDLAKFFSDNNVALVADTYTNAWADNKINEEPNLASVAKIYTGIFLNRGLRSRADSLVKMVNRFDADGMILHSNRSCKPYSIGQYDILKIAEKQTNKPGYILEADHVDPGHWNDTKIFDGLETFLESLNFQHR